MFLKLRFFDNRFYSILFGFICLYSLLHTPVYFLDDHNPEDVVITEVDYDSYIYCDEFYVLDFKIKSNFIKFTLKVLKYLSNHLPRWSCFAYQAEL